MRPRDVIYKDYTHYVYYITYTPLYNPCKFFAILPMLAKVQVPDSSLRSLFGRGGEIVESDLKHNRLFDSITIRRSPVSISQTFTV
jgi:hypothetical protein